MADTRLGDLDALEEGLIAALVSQAAAGSAPAAKQAQDSIAKLRVQRAAAAHRAKLAALAGPALVGYLGELGERDSDVEAYLGRKVTAEERDAMKAGARLRRLEVAAVELERVRAGAKPEQWMKVE